MSLVLVDASAALAWLLPDQATPRASAFVETLDRHTLYAPAIFEWEVLNVLNHRRGRRLNEDGYRRAVDDLAALEIEIAAIQAPGLLADVAHLAGLSLFDAAYLNAADARRGAVVSRDRRLLRACAHCGLEIYDVGIDDAP